MLLLWNCSLQTANALHDVVFPTVPLLGIGEGVITAAGGTKSGDRRWGTGGRGQVGEDGMGAGGTISLKGEFNSRLRWQLDPSGPLVSAIRNFVSDR